MITICTDLRLPEASEAVKVRLKKPENQEIKDQSFFSCCFDSQSAERLRESTEGSDLFTEQNEAKTESQFRWGQRPVTERNEVKTESQSYWGQNPVTERNAGTRSCPH